MPGSGRPYHRRQEIMAAVDCGYRVVLVEDAPRSSSDRTHDALMTLYRSRFAEQIETTDSDTIIAAWEAG